MSDAAPTQRASGKRKHDTANEGGDDAEELPEYLRRLYAVQAAADKWPFEFELLHATHFQPASETRAAIARITRVAAPSWSMKVFAKDDEGSLIGFFKDTIMILGADGDQVASLGSLRTLALLLAKRVQVPELKVDLEVARRYGFSQTDVSEMPVIAAKNRVFGELATLLARHFAGAVAARESMRTVMDDMDKPHSLKQFAQFIHAKSGKKAADDDDDDE